MSSVKKGLYRTLRLEHFTPLEARHLSILSRNTPALKLLREERQARWIRFEKIAARKIALGKWGRGQIANKWIKNLSRMYSKYNFRVKEGPKGNQTKMAKGSPNVWALYRYYERRVGGADTKRYVSPWQLRTIKSGKNLLDKGLLFVQKAKREGRPPPVTQMKQWIDQLSENIRTATGERRIQLLRQKNNLERRLGSLNEQ
jgi:hypothetical protein